MTIPVGFEWTPAGWFDSVTKKGPYVYDGVDMSLVASAAAIADTDPQLPPALGPQSAEESLSVVGRGYISDITVTRPANTTAYTAGDVVGATAAAITFADAGPTGEHVIITSADLSINVAAVPSGMSSFRLHLYSVTPPSALADNAAWDLPSGDRASYLGYIDLGTIVDVGSTLFVQATKVNQQYRLASASASLFGYLVTNGGFTPAGNSEVYKIRLRGVGL